MYRRKEIFKQRFKRFIEQINTDEFKLLSTMEQFTIIDKFFDENSELIADLFVKKTVKDLVNVKVLVAGDSDIFYMEGLEDVNQEDGQEE